MSDDPLHNPRLFVSFWHIELDNLPIGVFEHRRLVPEEARALIREARQHNSLLCLSAEDLLAPYKKRELARYKELCAVLDRGFGIPLAIDDFFSRTEHEGPSFRTSNPLNCVQVGDGNVLLIVTCAYAMTGDKADAENMGFAVSPDTVEFRLFSALSISRLFIKKNGYQKKISSPQWPIIIGFGQPRTRPTPELLGSTRFARIARCFAASENPIFRIMLPVQQYPAGY